jgi:hypothetical protein
MKKAAKNLLLPFYITHRGVTGLIQHTVLL